MSKRTALFLFLGVLAMSRATSGSTTSPRPLRQTELLALVAGNALPENIVNEIHTRGVAFRMDDSFRTQLTTAGAIPSILAALAAAKPPAKDNTDEKPDPALLQHIATAAKLMKDKHYDEAADELTATLKGNFEKFEIGFVMGEVLRQHQRWSEAAAVYSEVLRQSSDFPEAHTKLSYIAYVLGEPEQGLREANAALAQTPNNAKAHKNAGLALESMRKFDAAEVQFKEALRLKPDYMVVHYDLGILFHDKGDLDNSIVEYRKALALNPNYLEAHHNVAITFKEKGDLASAIREFREAKRLSPERAEGRLALASTLISANLFPEAIVELRELESIAPNSADCHKELGQALLSTWDLKGAEKELRRAVQLNPVDPSIHLDLGNTLENEKQYDAAVEEYQQALELDENSAHARRNIGRVLLGTAKFEQAVKELKQAEALAPSEAYIHELYAKALQYSGDISAAIIEFKESLALDPKQTNVKLELALALERKGDWVASLEQYRQAALVDNIDAAPNQPGVGKQQYGAPAKYSEAQERFQAYLASLKSAGKSGDAAKLEDAVRVTQASRGASEELDAVMLAGSQAFAERRFDDSERNYKEAAKLAEKLQSPEPRLVTALGHLGQLAMYRKDFATAQAAFER